MGENCEHGTAVVDCSVCSDRAAAVHACVEAAYAQGRADERAAIVAWLRAGGPAPRDATRWPCDSFANEIERGEHRKAKP